MILRTFAVVLGSSPFLGVFAGPLYPRGYPLDFESQLEKQNEVAFQGVLNNIGPKGSKAPGAAAGAIIASPSTQDPDYYFTWTRDAALTMKMIVDELLHGRDEFRIIVQDYIKTQAILQTVSNPSGALGSGRGLGEPKFYSNLTRFNGDWGRPQRDGPALRATALTTYARWLLESGRAEDVIEVQDKIWPVIINDLSYVAQYWNNTGFDLWEEIRGSSFFATAAQHRAIVEGAALGRELGISVSAIESQAPNILCFLQTFWNGQYAFSNINVEHDGYNRSGLDSNTVLTSLASFDPNAQCDDSTFQPCSSRALSNLKAYVDSFRTIYTINKDAPQGAPVATGRYAEDVYYEGQPWYLTTFAVAEQLYDAVQQWSTIESLKIDELSLPFWKDFYPSAKAGTYKKDDKDFDKLLDAVIEHADGFVKVALMYIPEDGALSEQFSRENGTQVSARDLTWSYASFITMRGARLSATSDYPQLPSWGGDKANQPPAVCESDSISGDYKPAVGAGAPPGAGGCTILVTFNVNASTYFGENVYLSGGSNDTGNWRDTDALPGDASGYTDSRPLWTFAVELPANSTLEYRYVRKGSNDTFTHEAKNRTLDVPACANVEGPGNATVEDAWDGPVPPKPVRLL